MTTTELNKIYKRALVEYKIRVLDVYSGKDDIPLICNGMCSMITMAYRAVYNTYNTPDKYCPYNNMRDAYPEIYKHKPKHCGSYWFNGSETAIRVKILRSAIVDTNPVYLQRINNEHFTIWTVRDCKRNKLKTVHSAIKYYMSIECTPQVNRKLIELFEYINDK